MEPRRRYLTFSLRTLFVLTTALAVWLGVVVHRAREQREAVKAIEALGGIVMYDWHGPPGSQLGSVGPPGPAWLRRIIGDDFFQEVHAVHLSLAFQLDNQYPKPTDSDIRSTIPHLTRLRKLKNVWCFDEISEDTYQEIKTALPDSLVVAAKRIIK